MNPKQLNWKLKIDGKSCEEEKKPLIQKSDENSADETKEFLFSGKDEEPVKSYYFVTENESDSNACLGRK